MSDKIPEFFGWLKREPNGRWHLVCHGDDRLWVSEVLQKLQQPGRFYSAVVLKSPETPYAEVMLRRKRRVV